MTRRIKILQAIRQGKVGGGETHVLDLVNTLDSTCFESVILSFTDGPMVDKLRAEGFTTYVIHTEKPFDISVWNKVKKIISNENIDIIHAHGTRANSNTFYAARALKIPLLYTVHGWSFHPDQSRIVKFIRTFSERFLVGVANRTICVSQSNLREGKSKFPMPKAIVIVNGVNQAKFDPNREYEDIRAEFGIPGTALLIGYIARITAQKEPLNFIRAIAKIPDVPASKFLIVGDGELKPQMIDLATEMQVKDRIIFENFRSDIPSILKAIDIFCLPSLWEGLPIALLEAMSMRKAVVATAIDGTKDLIKNMDNGVLIPPLSPDEIAKAIYTLITDAKLRENLGNEAQKTVQQEFNIRTMTKKIENEYKGCLPSFPKVS